MIFRSKRERPERASSAPGAGAVPAATAAATGPYDIADVTLPLDNGGFASTSIDLRSVIIPIPDGAQVQVEMGPNGPAAVHVLTPVGRLTTTAYSAPKSGGQWRHVAAELQESMTKEGAEVTVADGPFGREVVAKAPQVTMRFLGADGPRWMVRMVLVSPHDKAEEAVATARKVLANVVVRRGEEALPTRELLPVVLPKELAEQLRAAQQQAAQQAAQPEATGQPETGAAPAAEQPSAGATSSTPRPPRSASSAREQLDQLRRP